MIAADHQVLIDVVREFAREELVELDREWDRTEGSCCAQLGPLYEMGIMGLRIPESAGGLDCPMLPYAHIIRELAYASASVAVTVGVHNMVAEILRNFAAPEIRQQALERLGQRGHLGAFAISEANAGSDPRAARTRAEPVSGGWRLHGTKMWVTNGLSARWILVLARTPARAGAPSGTTGPAEHGPGATRGGPGGADQAPGELSMFLMDAQQPGVRRQPIHGKMGIRGSETAEMSLEGAFVPQEHLLGEPGRGLRVALAGLAGGRIGIAAQAAGIAQACLDLMVAYARQREQFGQKLAAFQAIQWMIADSQTELRAAQRLIDRAAWRRDQGHAVVREASMAKLYASEMANRVAYRAVQVHGGYGYVRELRVEQLYRDARITSIYEGTSEIQRRVIARELLRGG